jgi:excisionase family DNA binding protein
MATTKTSEPEGDPFAGAAWFSTVAAADYLGVPEWTIRRLVREGRLASYRSPVDRRGRWYAREDLDTLTVMEPVGAE